MSKLTQQQKAEIYCVKHGHASYVWYCFGYVQCGRCGAQIGDRLGGIFPANKVAVVTCPDSPCKVCDPIIKKLKPLDKKIFGRLKKDKDCNFDYKKILKGINFED